MVLGVLYGARRVVCSITQACRVSLQAAQARATLTKCAVCLPALFCRLHAPAGRSCSQACCERLSTFLPSACPCRPQLLTDVLWMRWSVRWLTDGAKYLR